MGTSQNVAVERPVKNNGLKAVPGTATSALILSANASRKGLIFHWKASAGEYYLLFDPSELRTASATRCTICLQPGDTWEPNATPIGDIYGSASVESGLLFITEQS